MSSTRRIKRLIDRNMEPTLLTMTFTCLGVLLAGHLAAGFWMLVGALLTGGIAASVSFFLSFNRG